jgi:hypothetical protein
LARYPTNVGSQTSIAGGAIEKHTHQSSVDLLRSNGSSLQAEAEEAGQRQIACSDLNTLLEHPDTMGLLSTVEGLDGVVKCLSDEEVVVRLEAAALTQ